jgi:hypothetical protein
MAPSGGVIKQASLDVWQEFVCTKLEHVDIQQCTGSEGAGASVLHTPAGRAAILPV